MKIIHISYEEFCDWVQKQDDARPVNMENNVYPFKHNDCGCVMAEYALEKFPGAGKIIALLSKIEVYSGDDLSNEIVFPRRIYNGLLDSCSEFGELKEFFVKTN